MRYWVSGATGSWGREIVARLLAEDYTEVVAFCRGEHRAFQLQEQHGFDHRLRCYIGDIRAKDRVEQSLRGVDVVIHAAALKRIDSVTYSPSEIASVNIKGTEVVIHGCIEQGVKKAFYVSSDKAALPTTFYGATKLVAEQLWLSANDVGGTRFGAARFGNALGSTGSVLRVWDQQVRAGVPLTVTDLNMTRFVITLSWAVGFLLQKIAEMQGGELWLPEMKAASLGVMAEAFVGKDYPVEIIGGRGMGEKQHEVLGLGELSSMYADQLSVESLRVMLREAGLSQWWRD